MYLTDNSRVVDEKMNFCKSNGNLIAVIESAAKNSSDGQKRNKYSNFTRNARMRAEKVKVKQLFIGVQCAHPSKHMELDKYQSFTWSVVVQGVNRPHKNSVFP